VRVDHFGHQLLTTIELAVSTSERKDFGELL
jgi:hypothetical protein